MEAVQKAVSDAVQAVKNSPLLRRRFGGGGRENSTEEEPVRAVSPDKDRTPFVAGFSYRVEYLGKSIVDQGQEQDHGCTDKAVQLLWSDGKTEINDLIALANAEMCKYTCNPPFN